MNQTTVALGPLGSVELDTVLRVSFTIVVLLFFFVLRPLLALMVSHRIAEASKRYVARKALTYGGGVVAVIALVWVWVGSLAGLATYLGILSAGLAIALQNPLSNLAGWLFILVRKPFKVGDRITVAEHTGDVIDITLFQWTILEIGQGDSDQSTGRLIHIPNGWVFTRSLRNGTQGFNFVWEELRVTVTFESDWKKAKKLLLDIAQSETPVTREIAEEQVRRASRNLMIAYQHLTPVVWTAVEDSGVVLTIRFPCPSRQRRIVCSRMWESILTAFGEHADLDFAYPTHRYYDNRTEGKGAQAARLEESVRGEGATGRGQTPDAPQWRE
jgi:small-conductance mechanosensitive channel